MDFHRATLDLGRNKLRKRDRVIYLVVRLCGTQYIMMPDK